MSTLSFTPPVNVPLEVELWSDAVNHAASVLKAKQFPGGEFTGWLDLGRRMAESPDLPKLKSLARQIRDEADVLVVIGIGGSYLGARALDELLQARASGPELVYLGNTMSETALQATLRKLEGKRVWVNVVSKSGTTTEPAISFRLVLDTLKSVTDLKKRIVATTDAKKGALREWADREGWPTLTIPDDVGGRYSVFTPVGLLPLAVRGLDVDALLAGAHDATRETLDDAGLSESVAGRYAVWRRHLATSGKRLELMAAWSPEWTMTLEWWKQLFGESEGKAGGGLFPASAVYSTDLHSLGQWVQEGPRSLFETMLWVDAPQAELAVPAVDAADGLDYLVGKSLHSINANAMQATREAHADGQVPVLTLTLSKLDEAHAGSLFGMFMLTCALSGLMQRVNPFDQPGVEAYKTAMFRRLGKPGY